ncbi:MAG: homoserine O-succinyltransferase [Aestuariibacter sp.]
MPIRVPVDLPAQSILDKENIFVMDSMRAMHQDIRPLHVGILNLMPNKIKTETQLCRLLSNTPLQINVDLIRIDNHVSKHTPAEHMDSFYFDFDAVADKRYDGLIVTGAPVALMSYEDINYWDKITAVMDWAKRHVQSTLYLCWGAHAAMYHHYGINRHVRQEKLFGVYRHEVLRPLDELVRGFDIEFMAPHSRYGTIAQQDYENTDGLDVVAASPEAGAYLIASQDKRSVFLTGHPEYDLETLQEEYQRDCDAGLETGIPVNYFTNNNPQQPPRMTWRSHGSLLFSNWLNYYVYQVTPYDIEKIGG